MVAGLRVNRETERIEQLVLLHKPDENPVAQVRQLPGLPVEPLGRHSRRAALASTRACVHRD